MNRRKEITIIAILSMFIALGAIIFAILMVSKPSNQNNPTSVVSYPTSPDSSINDFTFNLDENSLGTPINGKVVTFKFESLIQYADTITMTQRNTSAVTIQSKDFDIVIFTQAEGGGGIYNAQIAKSDINNKLGLSISRIEDENESFLKNEFSNYDISGNNFYFYTSSKEGDSECAKIYDPQFCGSDHLTIKSIIEDGTDGLISIYCSTKDSDSASFCDDFVSNLKLDTETVNTPVSY